MKIAKVNAILLFLNDFKLGGNVKRQAIGTSGQPAYLIALSQESAELFLALSVNLTSRRVNIF